VEKVIILLIHPLVYSILSGGKKGKMILWTLKSLLSKKRLRDNSGRAGEPQSVKGNAEQ
jgi:hypothetical protein